MILLTVALAALVGSFLFWINKDQKVNKSEFDWLASNSAPKGCLMRLIDGAFYYRGGGSLYIPPAFLHSGWGKAVSIHVVGADVRPLPDRVSVVFYSYVEDKFYRGDFPLPYDRIAELFAEGYDSYDLRMKAHLTFNRIIAGVAPGGVVAVWLEGVGRTQEVLFEQATELEGDWHQLMRMPAQERREDVRRASLEENASTDPLTERCIANPPIGIWATYRTPYAWRPVFDGMEPIKSVVYNYFNGESFELPISDAPHMHQAPRPVPSQVDIRAQVPDRDYKTWFQYHFDDDEIISAFKKFGAEGKPLDLVFRRHQLDGRTYNQVLLRQGDTELKLQKTKVEQYRVP